MGIRRNDRKRDGRQEGRTDFPLPPASWHSVPVHPVCPAWPPHLQPPSLSEWKPGRQRSHFQPVTVGLQTQVPDASHWRRREPGGGRAQGSGGPIGAGGGGEVVGPTTCRVAVTGLARCARAPAIEVLPAALAVWPGRVVPAAQAAAAVARAAEELPVERTLL